MNKSKKSKVVEVEPLKTNDTTLVELYETLRKATLMIARVKNTLTWENRYSFSSELDDCLINATRSCYQSSKALKREVNAGRVRPRPQEEKNLLKISPSTLLG